MPKKIFLWSIINAIGTGLYITIIALFMSNASRLMGKQDNWMTPIIVLSLLVISAAITGSLVIGRPILWYMEGFKSQAVKLFFATLGWMFIFLLIILALSVKYLKVDNVQPLNNISANMANPASVNCEKKGGQLVVQKDSNGGEYGLCFFDDGRACEEWAMMRGDCPVGGVKTTGFDTDAQKFCAWVGGQTLAVPNAICTFGDGSTCLADDLYSGKCRMGENNKK